MVMERLPPLSQLAKMASLLFILLLAPLIPSSLRPSYLYFLFNVLVVALGVEAGFPGAISSPRDDKKPAAAAAAVVAYAATSTAVAKPSGTVVAPVARSVAPTSPKSVDEESAADAVVKDGVNMGVEKMQKCPSRASIFFIGSLDSEADGYREEGRVFAQEEKEREGAGELTKQELFAKAETFIGSFYNQLKMQREESWKKLHGLYHHHYKAF